MSSLKEVSKHLIDGIRKIIDALDEGEIEKMVGAILEAKDRRILIVGAGRSGFVGRAFALRLMNLGFNVYVSGETITPALEKGDLVIAISGSGVTRTVVVQVEAAKDVGARIVAITSHPESPIGEKADILVMVKGRTKIDAETDYERRQIRGIYDLAPLGTMFELSAMVFLDSVVAELMRRLGLTELDMIRRHPITH
jgi:6-phospho-3-hexuloisomerase